MGVAARIVFGVLALAAGILFVGRDPVAALGHAVALWLICWVGQQGAQRSALWFVLGVVAYGIAFFWMPIVPLMLLFLGERFTRPKLVKGGRARPAPPGRPGPRMRPRPAPSRSTSPALVVGVAAVIIVLVGGVFVAYRAALPRKAKARARAALTTEFSNFFLVAQSEVDAIVEAAHGRCSAAASQREFVSARFDEKGYRACIDEAVEARLRKVLTLHSPEFFVHSDPRWWRVTFVVEGQGAAVPERMILRNRTNCEGQGEQWGESPTSRSLFEQIGERQYRSVTHVLRGAVRCHHSLVLAYGRWSLGPPLEFDTPPPPLAGVPAAAPVAAR